MSKEDEIRGKLQTIARSVKEQLPPDFGFVLLITSMGERGAMLYVANIDRGDALQVMREFIAVNMEERNWQQEMPALELDEEFELWWQKQQNRKVKQDLKASCRDAFIAGRITA